jgi:hypothetical protein
MTTPEPTPSISAIPGESRSWPRGVAAQAGAIADRFPMRGIICKRNIIWKDCRIWKHCRV